MGETAPGKSGTPVRKSPARKPGRDDTKEEKSKKPEQPKQGECDPRPGRPEAGDAPSCPDGYPDDAPQTKQ